MCMGDDHSSSGIENHAHRSWIRVRVKDTKNDSLSSEHKPRKPGHSVVQTPGRPRGRSRSLPIYVFNKFQSRSSSGIENHAHRSWIRVKDTKNDTVLSIKHKPRKPGHSAAQTPGRPRGRSLPVPHRPNTVRSRWSRTSGHWTHGRASGAKLHQPWQGVGRRQSRAQSLRGLRRSPAVGRVRGPTRATPCAVREP